MVLDWLLSKPYVDSCLMLSNYLLRVSTQLAQTVDGPRQTCYVSQISCLAVK